MNNKIKCLREKDLVLFYYRELENSQLRQIEDHLRECPKCNRAYEEIKSFASGLKSDNIELTEQDIEVILRNVKERLNRQNALKRLSNAFDSLKENLLYKPQLVPVMVAILVLVLGVTLWTQRYFEQKDFKILQLEMDLSLESEAGSVFDLYEDEFIYFEENLDNGLSLHRSYRYA